MSALPTILLKNRILSLADKLIKLYIYICEYYTTRLVSLMISPALLNLQTSKHQKSNAQVTKEATNFTVYWNTPTFQCSRSINFTETLSAYGIVHNAGDSFRGERIAILYDPGFFPALLEQSNSKQFYFRNGGIPQNGNLTFHLERIRNDIIELIPDEKFSGIGVIDFESWRPIFQQNFGSLLPYKEISKDFVRQQHPWWPDALIESEATRNFEKSARLFMEETLVLVKKMRPKATWGYYAYPYCFNMNSQLQRDCSSNVQKQNEKISWLFSLSDGYYPSLYMAKKSLTSKQKVQMIEGRLNEALRLRKMFHGSTATILPYFWCKYRDADEYFSLEDLHNSLVTIKSNGANGVILWGSSKDVNTKEKCFKLKDFIDNTLGPLVKNLTSQ